jgi:DNA-binding GntR family transcriptional regulator
MKMRMRNATERPAHRPEVRNGASRANFVFQSLLAALKKGQFSSGQRIREEEVAQLLGVSRTPVREALSRLQSRGLLEIAAGGLTVARLSRAQLIELYAMREILEGSAARFAAQHAAPSEIATLKHIARKFEGELGDPIRLARINRELHEGIYEAAHNRYLVRTLSELNDSLALLPNPTFSVAGRPELAAQEHASIISAIEKRNADRAERVAREHIRMAQEVRLAMMFDER